MNNVLQHVDTVEVTPLQMISMVCFGRMQWIFGPVADDPVRPLRRGSVTFVGRRLRRSGRTRRRTGAMSGPFAFQGRSTTRHATTMQTWCVAMASVAPLWRGTG